MKNNMSVHPFEQKGLGVAPFNCVGVEVNPAYSSCDFCNTAIKYEFKIKSSDGKLFKVGSDCVCKTNSKHIKDFDVIHYDLIQKLKFEKAIVNLASTTTAFNNIYQKELSQLDYIEKQNSKSQKFWIGKKKYLTEKKQSLSPDDKESIAAEFAFLQNSDIGNHIYDVNESVSKQLMFYKQFIFEGKWGKFNAVRFFKDFDLNIYTCFESLDDSDNGSNEEDAIRNFGDVLNVEFTVKSLDFDGTRKISTIKINSENLEKSTTSEFNCSVVVTKINEKSMGVLIDGFDARLIRIKKSKQVGDLLAYSEIEFK